MIGKPGSGKAAEEEIEWTEAELAEPSREEMLSFQTEPRTGGRWISKRGSTQSRLVTAFLPAGESRTRLPRVAYRVIAPDGSLGPIKTTYLSCFHTWARANHCAEQHRVKRRRAPAPATS